MTTPHASADLILKLYELRREKKLRKARQWFGAQNWATTQDVLDAARGKDNAYFRMVTSYWSMVAAIVLHGGIDAAMFHDANNEHVFVWAKLEPFLAEVRVAIKQPSVPHAPPAPDRGDARRPGARGLHAGALPRRRRGCRRCRSRPRRPKPPARATSRSTAEIDTGPRTRLASRFEPVIGTGRTTGGPMSSIRKFAFAALFLVSAAASRSPRPTPRASPRVRVS